MRLDAPKDMLNITFERFNHAVVPINVYFIAYM